MADARQVDTWSQTASLLAQIHNSNPYVKRAAKPSDFLPRSMVTNHQPEESMSLSEAAAMFGVN